MIRMAKMVDQLFAAIAAMTASGFTRLAPAVTPIAPAFFFGYAISEAVLAKVAVVWVGVLVGGAAVMGLEAAGYMAFHSAIMAYRNGAGWRAAILPGAYLVIGIATLWIIEGGETAVIGTALFLLAACVYASRTVSEDMRAQSRKAQVVLENEKRERDDDLRLERQMKIRQQQLEHELKLKRLEAKSQHKLAQINAVPASASTSQHEPAPTRLVCEDCGRGFGTSQARNAHKRFCKGKSNE